MQNVGESALRYAAAREPEDNLNRVVVVLPRSIDIVRIHAINNNNKHMNKSNNNKMVITNKLRAKQCRQQFGLSGAPSTGINKRTRS